VTTRARHPARAVVTAAWLLVAAATVFADAPPQSLAARARRFPPFTSARAAFDQERQVSLVDEVLRASGTIALRAPDHMRLELTAPETLTIAVDGDTLTVLDAKGAPIAVPPEFSGFARFGHVLTDLMLGQKAPDLFHEEWHGPDAVTLRTDAAEAPFSDITLRFPAGSQLPTEIVMRERGGDTTTIRMRPLPEAPATKGAP
jgi:outer membrane lipoprotein-sorting protein